jgi:transcriptional regulator of acetoin/glycerol metabolism
VATVQPGTFAGMKDEAVRAMLARELQKRNGNKRKTARELGIDRGYLYWLIKRYRLNASC